MAASVNIELGVDTHAGQETIPMVAIHGDVNSTFEPVAQVFQQLFTEMGELGAGVSVRYQGEEVLNLWAGTRNKDETLAWQSDTRSNIFSASKAIVAVAILQLVDRGALTLDQPIADVWPEFAAHGKERISVKDVLCHRSGVNAFHDKVDDEAIYDWNRITELVAAEEPWWPPGETQGYSPMLFGWVLGEVIRRVSGCQSFNDYVQQYIAQPLGLSCTFGLPSEELSQVADVVAMQRLQKDTGTSLVEVIRENPRGVTNRAFTNPMSLMIGTNKPAWRQAQIPAANGQASARDLATLFASLSNSADERLLSSAQRHWLWREQTSGMDQLLHQSLSFSLGFMRILPAGVQSKKVFCHPGAGGSLGYGDAQQGIGFGFVSRVMGQAILIDERAELLLQAVYQCVRGESECPC